MFTVMIVTSYTFMVTPFDWHELVGIIFAEPVFFIVTSIFIDSRQRLENSILALIAAIGLASLYLIREWVACVPVYGLGYRPGSVAGDPNLFSASALRILCGLPAGDDLRHPSGIVAGRLHCLGRAPATADARCASPRKIRRHCTGHRCFILDLSGIAAGSAASSHL
jgi:hypothetical protein